MLRRGTPSRRLVTHQSMVMWVALVLLVTSCASDDPELASSEGAPQEPVSAGAVLSIAGAFESLGLPERQGLELALEEINAEGGVLGGREIQLTVYDDEGDQSQAVQLANRLVHEDDVDVIFGPSLTPQAELIAETLEAEGVLQIGFTLQSYIWDGTDHIFMSAPSEARNAEAMVRDAADAFEATTVAVAWPNVPFGVGGREFLLAFAEEHGLEVVADENWGESDLNFTSQVNAINQADPDVILMWGSCATADAQVIKALGEGGVTATIIGNLCVADPTLFEIAGAHAEGVRSHSTLDLSEPGAEAAHFIESYEAEFDSTPGPFAAAAFDGMHIWAMAMEEAGTSDAGSVAEALEGLTYMGAAGQYNITADDHQGLGADAYKLIVAQDGEWVSVP